MFKELHVSLELLKKEAVLKNCKTALVVSVTTQPTHDQIKIFPIRYLQDHVCLPIGIINDVVGRKLAKQFDGKVDTIFVDAENKIKHCKNIFDKILSVSQKSKIYAIKGNDFSADAAFSLICLLLKSLAGKRICVVGAGNIGSKVALKLIECGVKVFILNSTKNSTKRTSNAINTIKPLECKDSVVPITKGNFPTHLDCIIGFTRGMPAITKKMISSVKNDGVVLDGGTGSISHDGIIEAKRRNLKLLRLDIRMGFISYANLMLNTDKLISNVMGIRKINDFNIVAGGFIGNRGDVIVDNIKKPKKIFGVADGTGNLFKHYYAYKNNVNIISKKIMKK